MINGEQNTIVIILSAAKKGREKGRVKELPEQMAIL
jgi:hypothetical protein